jgi:hypothetical protein
VDQKWARTWFAATGICVVAGLVIQLFVSANMKQAVHFHDATARVLNVFCFFTIWSNIMVAVTTLLLAAGRDRSSTAFDTFRLIGLVAITITGLVYHVALSGLLDLESWALVANELLHTVVPVLAVAGWLMFGPRRRTSSAIVRLSALFPIVWGAFTLIRGAIIHYYPYPFIDVDALGYFKALVNAVWIGILFLGVAAGATAIDQRLGRVDV